MGPELLAGFDVFAGKVVPTQDTAPDAPELALYRWLHFDMNAPETAAWMQKHLPAIPATAMVQPETRPRSNMFEDGVLINLRGVNLNSGADEDDMVSLRMWMTPRLIVTGRFRRIFAAVDLQHAFKAGHAPPTTAGVVAHICHGLTDRIEEVSLKLEESASDLEDALLDDKIVDANILASTRRKAIRLRRHIIPTRDAMHVLASPNMPQIGPDESVLLHESANRMDRSVDEILAVGDRLTAVSDQRDALHANRIGRNSYVLSVVAAIFLPLSFLTGLFGMNVGGVPWVDWPLGFAVLCAIMVAIGVALYLIFRARRWF